MKHMVLSFEMKEDVISDYFLMLRFLKDSLDRVDFRSYGRESRVLNLKVTFRVLNVPRRRGRGGVTGLGLSHRFYQLFWWLPLSWTALAIWAKFGAF